ncbi:uncharacterized protein LOC129724636 isoform X2 [Wyeomyia smithii]|uniref:uncharacterized protein LOC129724636 isoform X2 n=1 Tax=Wyeomyia smithii TaxID=174621 RepID=UPI002467B070|nr:uncharacterized protein LOC129724636 isoform X2 [Wyeomyia smithii]
MEQINKKLDAESYQKLVENKISDESLMHLNDDDLIEMGIHEKGPRKLILTFIEQNDEEYFANENTKSNFHQEHETIRSILANEPKFHKTLTRQLDYKIVPNTKDLLHMNRILTKYFFEKQILQEKRYPSVQQKQKLSEQIIEAFPHLDQTRVCTQAPREVQQAYERLHINYNKNADLETVLSIGLLMDQGGWSSVTDKYLRGALRIIKK